jgi:hypothetical protein
MGLRGREKRFRALGNGARGTHRWWMGASAGGSATAAATGDRQPRAGASDELRYQVYEPYQLTRWSNTYSGAGAGMSSQCNWVACFHSGGPRPAQIKCRFGSPRADGHDRQLRVAM